ncbi:hypothetical protein DMB92_05235 [Campylobacter sp. MIT 99-7217]|uniref:hypothetical protein n=1 Tax=Campylobacter sp. MIT 99-7217 TaxID=535091 RepID=UPI00115B16F0|nr:hypothetical protein [Campylobacter sp. MIT 99-7217]TQR31792.1 hypothetical protein DMB92_05235 [Campylobacter sp. MIT 99-7217]
MISKELKAEIRFYYETHLDENKEVAKKFNVSYRTLMTWIQKEGWEKGKGVKKVLESDIKQNLIKKEFGTIIDATSEKIKENVKANLGQTYYELNDLVRNNLLDNLSDELLMKAMGINFLQKNMALGALIAKDELTRMLSLRKEGKGEPLIIAGAEKYVNILATLQKSFYSNSDASLNLNVINVSEDLSKLSQKELLERIQALEDKEK